MHKRAQSYSSLIIFIILIMLLLGIFFVNPKVLWKNDFKAESNETNYKEVKLTNNEEIVTYIGTWVEAMPGAALREKTRGEINEAQADEIIENNEEARGRLRTYQSNGDEKELYWALFYTQVERSYYYAYPFINCVDQVSNTSRKYTPLFYYLSQADTETIGELERTKRSIDNSLESNTHPTEDKETIITSTKEAENIEQRYHLSKLQCERFRDYLTKDYQKQRNLLLFKLSLLAILIAIFIIFRRGGTREKINTFTQNVALGWQWLTTALYPHHVRNSTVRSILKISPVTTTLVAFLGIALNIGAFNNWVIVFLVIISVLSLMASIVLGIVGLNTGNEKEKKACYALFVFGMFLFLIFFIVVIFSGIGGAFFKVIAESAKIYLGNQTSVN